MFRFAIRQPLRLARPTFQTATPIRTFSYAQRLRLKEDHDHSPEEAEQHKQESMKNPEGHRGVKSSSEEHIGADREKVHDHDDHMEDLQKETAQKHEEEHPHGKS